MSRAWIVLIGCLWPAWSCAAGKTVLGDFLQEFSMDSTVESRIFLMQMDVTHDGKPELFVAASYLGGAFGLDWAVYSPQGDGTYQRLGIATFHYEAFYYSPAASLLSVYVRISAAIGGYTHFHIGADGIRELPEQPDDDAEGLRVADWKKEGRPKLYWTRLADLVGSQPAVWKDYYNNEAGPDLGRLDGVVARSQ